MRFKRKFGKLFAATAGVAAIAASIGLSVSPAFADISVKEDTYTTGKGHITINKTDNSADPALYPNRFEALQIFTGTPVKDNPRQLTNITWGKSINNTQNAVLEAMVKSDAPLKFADESVTGLDEYKSCDTFGKLFATWLNSQGIATGLTGGSGELSPDAASLSSKVTAQDVAEFLTTFANFDYKKAEPGQDVNAFPNSSIFTKSSVATAFAEIFTNQDLIDGATEKDGWNKSALDGQDATRWTSMAFDGTLTDSATGVGDSLEHEDGSKPTSIEKGNATSWVIDSLSDDTAEANSEGLPAGYYLVLDRFSSVSGNLGTQITPPKGNEEGNPTGIDSQHAAGVLSEYILQVVGTEGTVIDIKADSPSLDKAITGVDTTVDADSVAVGDTVSYTLTGTLPENIKSFDQYEMKFKDTFGDALKLDPNSVKVYVGSSTAKPGSGATEVDLTASGITGDKLVTSGGLTVTIDDIFKLQKPESGGVIDIVDAPAANRSVIYVTYNVTITDAAVVSADPQTVLKNTASLEFSNDPYSDGTGTTPDDSTQTYTYGLNFKKTQSTVSGEALAGAGVGILQAKDGGSDQHDGKELEKAQMESGTSKSLPADDTMIALFQEKSGVYQFVGWAKFSKANMADGEVLKAEIEGKIGEGGIFTPGEGSDNVKYKLYAPSGADGSIKFEGLDEGAYTVFEAVTPKGYETFDPYTLAFTAVESETESKLTAHANADDREHQLGTTKSEGPATVVDGEATDGSQKDGKIDLTIADVRTIDLPVTGGMGTILFYTAGAALIVGGVAYAITRKKNAVDAE